MPAKKACRGDINAQVGLCHGLGSCREKLKWPRGDTFGQMIQYFCLKPNLAVAQVAAPLAKLTSDSPVSGTHVHRDATQIQVHPEVPLFTHTLAIQTHTCRSAPTWVHTQSSSHTAAHTQQLCWAPPLCSLRFGIHLLELLGYWPTQLFLAQVP